MAEEANLGGAQNLANAYADDDDKATPAEWRRFRTAFSKDEHAKEKLDLYLEWRKENSLDDGCCGQGTTAVADAQVWTWAVRKAIAAAAAANDDDKDSSTLSNDDNESKTSASSTERTKLQKRSKWHRRRKMTNKTESFATSEATSFESADNRAVPDLPQVVFCHKIITNMENNRDKNQGGDDNDHQHEHLQQNDAYFRDADGHRILHVLAARLDPQMADAATHTSVMALYLDQILDRHQEERVTILLDVRPGAGWRNPPAMELVGLIRHLATRLQALFPDRLHRCVLYPIPRPAIFVWKMVSVFLHAQVRSAVCLIAGEAHLTTSPLPRQALLAQGVVADEACLEHCEQVRLATFSTRPQL